MVAAMGHGAATAAAMPALDIGGLRQGKKVFSSQSFLLGSRFKSCDVFSSGSSGCGSGSVLFRKASSVVGAYASSVVPGNKDGGSIPHRSADGKPEVYFYGAKSAAARRVQWGIGSVAGAEKETTGTVASELDPLPFASWSNLGFKGGKRTDLKKILILGAGLFTNPFCSCSSSVFVLFVSAWCWILFWAHVAEILTAIPSCNIIWADVWLRNRHVTGIHELANKRVSQPEENYHSRSWFIHQLFSSSFPSGSVLVHFVSAGCWFWFGLTCETP